MKIPRRTPGGATRSTPNDYIAAEDSDRLALAAAAALEGIDGVDWYREAGTEVDRAAFTLCRLRRARAGLLGGSTHGDEAVRAALAAASPEALVWLASRTISYLDETGFPEAVERWFPDESE